MAALAAAAVLLLAAAALAAPQAVLADAEDLRRAMQEQRELRQAQQERAREAQEQREQIEGRQAERQAQQALQYQPQYEGRTMDVMEAERQAQQGAGDGCLVATAAYGTELAPQVQALREIRDSTVMTTASGAAFMSAFNHAYYAFSPAVADAERQSPELRGAVGALLAPMIWSLGAMGLAEPGSELQVAGLGALVILANAAMYGGAPAAALLAARRAGARP